jgi:hypothetical protein
MTSNKFWNWFLDNQQILSNIHTYSSKYQTIILTCLNNSIKYYCENLNAKIIIHKSQNLQAELVIYPTQKSDFDTKIKELIIEAPLLQNWTFSAVFEPQ